ncbi:hypothetical protein BC937DRAFT_89148 [Endogone sp. FLAS-F59071]|nr:hypothetical protein BC937DRAFT_89148 [Endogone sp. FLAS-F59071]|eukprot:RUS18101.1 hypothetical protein BC937DRAFT_89148 [Endogone sp. FLAS-F59071]
MASSVRRRSFLLSRLLVAALLLSPFLAWAALDTLSPLSNPPRLKFLESVLEKSSDQNYCNPTGIISDSCCDFETVEKVNEDLYGRIQDLIKTKFFRYYKLNLYKECSFWSDDGLCMNRDCSVATVEDEDELPAEWRSEALGALKTSTAGTEFHPFDKCEFNDQDFCEVMDEANSGVYVNLLENPERFTGYAGASAARVWKSIYEENCFNIVHKMTQGCPTCNNIMAGNGNRFAPAPTSKRDLSRLLSDLAEDVDGGSKDSEEVCLEKRVYYRLISGLHSSISIHICDEYFDRRTGKWGPNLECFITRVGLHPERLQNVYFNYVLLLRALTKLAGYLEGYNFCTGDSVEDKGVKVMVNDLIGLTLTCPSTFDEKLLFQGPEARVLKEEFRDHFRNVTRIMDCVGCEKCRLWGKLQTSGLGTALKVLFSYEDEYLNPKTNPSLLQRTEIVAFFNTLNRFSESIRAIGRFREMYQEKVKSAEREKEKADRLMKLRMQVQAGKKEKKEDKSSVASSAPTPSSQPLKQPNNTTILPANLLSNLRVSCSTYLARITCWIVDEMRRREIPVPAYLEQWASDP